jgi:hypothetical protein
MRSKALHLALHIVGFMLLVSNTLFSQAGMGMHMNVNPSLPAD